MSEYSKTWFPKKETQSQKDCFQTLITDGQTTASEKKNIYNYKIKKWTCEHKNRKAQIICSETLFLSKKEMK